MKNQKIKYKKPKMHSKINLEIMISNKINNRIHIKDFKT